METFFLLIVEVASRSSSFNFLASLINGNDVKHGYGLFFSFYAFNFLASLINGNAGSHRSAQRFLCSF